MDPAEAQPASPSWKDRLEHLGRRVPLSEDQIFLVLILLIGAVVGLTVVAFIIVTEDLGARMYPAGGVPWRRLVVPVLGALVTGFLLYRYFPEARGSGVPQTKAALFAREGRITLGTVLGKFLCTAGALASGIPLGREGPAVQVGAGIASVIGRRVGLSRERIKALVPAGAAAAVAAAFNTPLAAVLFTLEELMGNLHAPVLGSVVLSAATSWIVLRLSLGDEPLFHVPGYELVHPVEFIFYALLGLVGGFVSVAFVKLLLRWRQRFLAMPARTRWIQPVAGGLAVGVVGWFVPEVLGVGYGFVGEALNGQMALKVMAALVVLKLITVAMAYASGNAGGIFGPSLFLGAMVGGAVGSVAHFFFPEFTASPGAYALVGMGTAFAGIIRAPMTSVIMIFEVTRDYSIIVPLMISNLFSFYISLRLQPRTVYEALALQDGIHLPSSTPRGPASGPRVAKAMRAPALVLSAGSTVKEALDRAHRSEFRAWPVMEGSRLLGVVSAVTLEEAVGKGEEKRTLAELLPPGTFPHVHADQGLDLALERMGTAGLDVLPVVSRANVRDLEGVVVLADILGVYGIAQRFPASEEPPDGAAG